MKKSVLKIATVSLKIETIHPKQPQNIYNPCYYFSAWYLLYSYQDIHSEGKSFLHSFRERINTFEKPNQGS